MGGQLEDVSAVNESTKLKIDRTLSKCKSKRRHATERVNTNQEAMGR
jgi:hypothetical protein